MPKSPRYAALVTNQAAGRYSLPDQITVAWAELARLREHVIPEPARVDVTGLAAAELRQQARAGGDLLTRVPNLAKAEAEAHAAKAARLALKRATAEAEVDWESAVVDHLDAIVRDHLAPVHDALVAEARELWPLIAHITTPAEAVAADDATRAAYLRFDQLAVQWAVVRDTGSRANDAAEEHVEHQALARFYLLLRNPAEVWDGFARLQHQVRATATPPWHGTSRERLVWLASTPAADAWLPTVSELNALVREQHATELDDARRGQLGGQAVRAWAGV